MFLKAWIEKKTKFFYPNFLKIFLSMRNKIVFLFEEFGIITRNIKGHKGESEIRTHGTCKSSSDFKSDAIDHSAISPKKRKNSSFLFFNFFFNIFQFTIFYASKEEVPVNLIDPGFGFLPIENSRFPTATLPSFTFSGNTPSFGWIN